MQPATSAAALGQLQTQESQAQDPNAILQAQNNSLGVGTAQQTVQGLQGAINNTTKLLQQVAPSVMGRTQNSLVTDAQATKQVENEQAPLNTQLGTDTTQYNQAGTNLQNLENQAQTAATGIYQGQQDKISYDQNLYNTLYQQEQNASQQAEAEREFNVDEAEKQSEAAASSNSGLGAALASAFGSGGSAAAPSGGTLTGGAAGATGKTAQDAHNAVTSLLQTNNAATIANTYNAIQKSAANGSTYDQAKLQLLQTLAPGIFQNGQLNTAYLQRTLGTGIKLF